LAVLKDTPVDPTIEYMWEQEKALHGKESGIACTVAVEASITEHYNDQIRELTNSDKEEHNKLMRTIIRFRNQEQEHYNIGLENDAELVPAYHLLSGAIKIGIT
jgi:ubiquinone biosynthesis monooxygenase Coq7